jgi:hypothetical protein
MNTGHEKINPKTKETPHNNNQIHKPPQTKETWQYQQSP